MPVAEYERAVALLQQNEEDLHSAGPRPPELIEAAGRAVGIRFPPTYRRFLSQYGSLAFAGTEIYGVIDDDFENSSIPDAIWYNLMRRREGYGEGLFSFYSVGEGTEFCLDTTRAAENREMPVVAVYLSGEARDEVAPDFGSAFLMLVEEALGFDHDE